MNCDKKDLLLYAVTDRSWLNGRTLKEVVKESLDGGVTFVQLREKHLDQEHFLEEARELKELCKEYHVPFVINDNVDIAVMMDADGVHVGQSDMEAVAAYTTARTTMLFSKKLWPITFFSHTSPSRSIRKMGTTI